MTNRCWMEATPLQKRHTLAKYCLRTFKTEHGLSIHIGHMHKPDEYDNDDEKKDPWKHVDFTRIYICYSCNNQVGVWTRGNPKTVEVDSICFACWKTKNKLMRLRS